MEFIPARNRAATPPSAALLFWDEGEGMDRTDRIALSKAATQSGLERMIGGNEPPVMPASPLRENPPVSAGKVKWHANLQAAIATSQRSNKPIFLFQMLGKLEDKFC